MKPNFKKLNSLVLLTILTSTAVLAILVNACKKTSSSSYNDNIQLKSTLLTSLPGYITLNNVPEGFKQLGQLHNAGLDSVFNTLATELRAHTSSVRISPAGLMSSNKFDYDAVLKNALEKFFATNPTTAKSYRIMGPSFVKYAQNRVHVNEKGPKKSILSLDESGKGSNALQTLLNQITVALSTKFKQNSMLQLKVELEKINNNASKMLSNGEANEVYAATSVGFASYQYWFKNYRKWYFAMQYPTVLAKYSNFQLNYLYFKKNIGTARTNSLRTLDADTIYYVPELSEVDIYPDYADEAEDDGIDIQGIVDGISDWWSKHGEDTVKADIQGAITGGEAGAVAGWNAAGGTVGIVADPEGAVVTVGSATLLWGAGTGVGDSMTTAGWDTIWDSIGH
ncbi:hypothetical protein ACFS5N_09825 [Mucilaginibacter ximonensis]|uniref:Uncharacterized protein n=1 Tax=Mucilaginibacter ximonensis TaxID=538021 RepID=A0ABW5YBW9_9SPHI